jgi:hypothetical protein
VLSNDPEKVTTAQPLARAGLQVGQPVHFLWHHLNASAEKLSVVVRLCNAGNEPAAVHVLGADSGPSSDEVYVGHLVMRKFVDALDANAGSVFNIPPRQECEISRLVMPRGQIVSGLLRLTPLSGKALFVETEAVPAGDASDDLEPVPQSMTPQSPTRSLELPGYKQLELRQVVGKAWQFASIGRSDKDAELHPRLRGDYGVLHDARITFANPDGVAARMEVALRSGGGAARAVVEVNGRVMETGLLREGSEEILFKETTTATERRVSVRLIPQSGSTSPLSIIARSFVK